METTEIIDTVATTVENACQMGEPIPQWPDYNVADYFLNGGVGPMTVITKFGASPPSFTAENPVVFSEHHHPKTLKTL